MYKKITQLLLLFALIYNSTTLYGNLFSKPKQKQAPTMIGAPKQKDVILIDLTGILFKESKTGFAKKLGYGALANYALTHWKNPGHTCLDMLNHISTEYADQKPKFEIFIQKRTMPQCIVDLNKGTKKCPCVKNELLACIEQLDKKNYFKSSKEKKLMSDIIALIFDPQETPNLIEPIKPMVNLTKNLKAAGHPVYIFANAPQEFYATIQTKHADIMSLFDGVVISSNINMLKPEETMFKHLFEKHKLDPRNCILIDEQEGTCATAQKFGMKTIMYDKPSNVMCNLKKLGIRL